MKWKLEIVNDDGPREVVHFSGKSMSLSWEKYDGRRYDFKVSIKEVTLIKEDFMYYHGLEKGEDRCNLSTLNLYLVCGEFSLDVLKFTGTFSMSSGSWDIDKCIVRFKVESLNPYECLDKELEDLNILDLGLTAQQANFGFEYGYDSYDCVSSGPGTCFGSPEAPTSAHYATALESSVGFHYGFLWHYIISDCGYDPGGDWTILDACSGGTIKYRKSIVKQYSPDVYERTLDDVAYFNEEFEFVVNFPPKTYIDNGLKLWEVMQLLLDDICSGYTIVSDFFQHNPENENVINYVTQVTNIYTNLLIFQKSDVKRPDALNNATKAETNFIKLLENVLKMFNCAYRIDGTDFRIEHVSWFSSRLGTNLLTERNKKLYLKGTRKYSYEDTRLPKYEKFKFMEASYEDFVGRDIIYDSSCVNNREENASKTEIENITTDIFHCLENPASDSEEVSDEGFVIIACDSDNNMIFDSGILNDENVPNNVLGWAHLHDKLWKHGRVLYTGTMNDVETEFISVVPSIKQDKFSVVLGCSEIKDFDPLDQIKAMLGWGYVETAELILSQCQMALELSLERIELYVPDQLFGDFDEDFDEDFD